VDVADIVKINCSINSKKVCVLCIYRHHSQSINKFIEYLSRYLLKIHSKNVIIIGDINIDISKSGDAEVDSYLLMMASFGLSSLVSTHTRITNNSATTIDHIFVRSRRNSCFDFSPEVLNFGLSDHHMLSLTLDICSSSTQNKFVSKVILKINYTKLNTLLSDESCVQVMDEADVNIAFERFISVLSTYIKKCTSSVIPLKRYFKKQNWISSELYKKISLKNKLAKSLKKHSNNSKLKLKVESLIYQINQEIPIVKSAYYMTKFGSYNCDLKKNGA
jgi:hypothetical protein